MSATGHAPPTSTVGLPTSTGAQLQMRRLIGRPPSASAAASRSLSSAQPTTVAFTRHDTTKSLAPGFLPRSRCSPVARFFREGGSGTGASGNNNAGSAGGSGGAVAEGKAVTPLDAVEEASAAGAPAITQQQGNAVPFVPSTRQRHQDKVREDGVAGVRAGAKYSSLSMDPKERVHEDGQPCGGEKMLLMFDRWHKLLKSFHNEKKDRFDISKVPDIYDSAKYDAIHNGHLGLDVLEELYVVAKLLADVVIPCEYGLDSGGKLRIGSKIANELLGKLLVDLASMREESMATAFMEPGAGARGGAGTPGGTLGFNYDQLEGDVGRISLQDEAMVKHHSHGGLRAGPASAVSSSRGEQRDRSGPAPSTSGTGGGGTEGGAAADGAPGSAGNTTSGGGAGGGEMEPAETETIHRLCPTYASDINSPLRHVRTRIYFTSESHMHSLVNVLRWCHEGPEAADCCPPPITPPSGTGGNSSPDLRASAGGAAAAAVAAALATEGGASSPVAGAASGAAGEPAYGRQFDNSPLLSANACAQLDDTTELDYLTQVVFRMYENKTVPVESPERFRVEVLFSPGANYNPFDFTMPLHNNHVLPTIPRTALHKGDGITLAEMEEKLLPFSQTRKFNTCSYALQYSLRAPHLIHGGVNSRYGSTGALGHNGRSTASIAGNDSTGDLAATKGAGKEKAVDKEAKEKEAKEKETKEKSAEKEKEAKEKSVEKEKEANEA